jgi:hypothetical protein
MTDPTPNAPTPTPLSPAAQAVRDAAFDADFEIDFANLDATFEASINKIAAAALRAAADQVVPENQFGPPENAAAAQREITRAKLLAITTELKNQP